MIKVRVPATTANLGPGFDTLGLALNLYNEFTFTEIGRGFETIGFKKAYKNSNNLVYSSMLTTFEKIGHRPKGIRIEANINIPISRGLGSSASCILAGVIGANELVGGPLDMQEILELATEIEGHPDNVAPALFGGLVISLRDQGKIIYNKMDIHAGLKFVALVPDFTLSTEEARSVLPEEISYQDAINNISRVSLLLSALANGKFGLLKTALKDRLHQPYRGCLIKDFDKVMAKVEELNGLGAYLSGAGPTIMCLVNETDKDFVRKMGLYLKETRKNWRIMELKMDLAGSQIMKG